MKPAKLCYERRLTERGGASRANFQQKIMRAERIIEFRGLII